MQNLSTQQTIKKTFRILIRRILNKQQPTHKIDSWTKKTLGHLARSYKKKNYEILYSLLLLFLTLPKETQIEILSKEYPYEKEKRKSIRGSTDILQSLNDIKALAQTNGLGNVSYQKLIYYIVLDNENENRLDYEFGQRVTKEFIKPEIINLLPDPKKMDGPQKLAVSTSQRIPARNRVRPESRRYKPQPIKLCLQDFSNPMAAIRHAMSNSYRWSFYNIGELRNYTTDFEDKLNPLSIEMITSTPGWNEKFIRPEFWLKPEHGCIYSLEKKREVYNYYGISWNSPAWLEALKILTDLWEISRTKELRNKYWTVKEWYASINHMLYPEVRERARRELEPDYNMVIENRNDLDRTGIFEDLEYSIKKALKIDDMIESAYHNWDDLNRWERIEVTSKINSEEGWNHRYAQLIRERLKSEYAPEVSDLGTSNIETEA